MKSLIFEYNSANNRNNYYDIRHLMIQWCKENDMSIDTRGTIFGTIFVFNLDHEGLLFKLNFSEYIS
jgi:hypothetical protein